MRSDSIHHKQAVKHAARRPAASARQELRLAALAVKQSPGRTVYTFAVDGKLVPSFATISRVSRHEGKLQGYQRTEVLSHVEDIRNYVESPSPMIPNAVVLAFDSRVRFHPRRGQVGPTTVGTLVIPLCDELADEKKPGFVVDGQQRLAAIREAQVESFPLLVSAFITDDLSEQTAQFLLVNSSKPLRKDLIYELLPKTNAPLAPALQRRRFSATLLERLNQEPASPFHLKIRTVTNPSGTIKDNSILKMLENSLAAGALCTFRERGTLDGDVEAMLELLRNYWTAVSRVFATAWALPPRKSRITHGAGIISMGFLMDAISLQLKDTPIPSVAQYEADLKPLAPVCHWTAGTWDFGEGRRRKWNELQNIGKDLDMLTDHIQREYRRLVLDPLSKKARSARRRS
ncbi:DGQHR domain-containing protein DpdB [Archangium lansingense]|uniref:DGQHR domain-containing protein DpdB n=1 Tax=Archangium lansingense TaxID=2995310 RepID=UPI003B78A086